jgi:predicted nucleotidyltransferase
MQMVIDGNNSFHTGWLARFLGLPRFCPGAAARKTEDVDIFLDGWDMCDETLRPTVAPRTDFVIAGIVYGAFRDMLGRKQAHAGWINDDGEDVVLPTTSEERR